MGKGGNDTLNFSAYTTSLNFTLTALGNVDGFNGTVNAIIGIFTNINAIIGGTGTDTLNGLNATSSWQLSLISNQYVSTNTLTFSLIENLNGGSDGGIRSASQSAGR